MIGDLTNHLWQSTLFAVVAGLLTLAFRQNRAQVRYWLWFSASFKFFIPFSLLMSAGSHIGWAASAQRIAARVPAPTISFMAEQIAHPFSGTWSSSTQGRDWGPSVILGLWLCGFSAIALIRLRDWLRIRAAVRASTAMEISARVQVRCSPGLLEPGVVGLLYPILLLPAGIAERLTSAQLEAVLAHELCHIRRRDNLFACIHMIAEAAFWFHPLVWWIGARLVEERERACDEEVLSLGNEPRIYAEGILNICQLYLESPLVCVSGVTGSDLKKRIQTILTGHVATNLNIARKASLVIAGMAAVAVPIGVGMMHVPAIRAQDAHQPQFEVASIKLITEPRGLNNTVLGLAHGKFEANYAALRQIAGVAYGIQRVRVIGGPAWMDTDLYRITAKANPETSPDELKRMLQTLLTERFKFAVHRDTKQGTTYRLVQTKNGSKLEPAKERGLPKMAPAGPGAARFGGHPLVFQNMEMVGLVNTLANFLGSPVKDETGLAGQFNFTLEWAMAPPAPRHDAAGAQPPADPGPSVFEALQEQLGLKLEPSKGPIDILVVDHAEKATPN